MKFRQHIQHPVHGLCEMADKHSAGKTTLLFRRVKDGAFLYLSAKYLTAPVEPLPPPPPVAGLNPCPDLES